MRSIPIVARTCRAGRAYREKADPVDPEISNSPEAVVFGLASSWQSCGARRADGRSIGDFECTNAKIDCLKHQFGFKTQTRAIVVYASAGSTHVSILEILRGPNSVMKATSAMSLP